MDALCTADYIQWLRKKKKDADIVLWYWNIAYNSSVAPETIDNSLCGKWSFSRLDCKKYGMRFNPLPYFKEVNVPSCDKEYGVVFVGKDKGRLSALLEYRAQFEEFGLKTKFVITPDHPYSKNPEYSKRVSYMESVKLGRQAKAILDYIEVDHSGQSLRILEALFLQEKVITNSRLIFDYDFYCPENIFVLGYDDMSRLPEFLNTPYKPISEEIVMKYDFDAAIERFFSEGETYFDKMLENVKER